MPVGELVAYKPPTTAAVACLYEEGLVVKVGWGLGVGLLGLVWCGERRSSLYGLLGGRDSVLWEAGCVG